jgi:hypothetical protein
MDAREVKISRIVEAKGEGNLGEEVEKVNP